MYFSVWNDLKNKPEDTLDWVFKKLKYNTITIIEVETALVGEAAH